MDEPRTPRVVVVEVGGKWPFKQMEVGDTAICKDMRAQTFAHTYGANLHKTFTTKRITNKHTGERAVRVKCTAVGVGGFKQPNVPSVGPQGATNLDRPRDIKDLPVGQVGFLRGDPERLRQAVLNYAWKYGIPVRTSAAPTGVRVLVTDMGDSWIRKRGRPEMAISAKSDAELSAEAAARVQARERNRAIFELERQKKAAAHAKAKSEGQVKSARDEAAYLASPEGQKYQRDFTEDLLSGIFPGK
jgi:hypothetical protein